MKTKFTLLFALICTELFAQQCWNDSTGNVPFIDTMPTTHRIAGQQLSAQIIPRNLSGQPDTSGRIVFAGMGMSNAQQIFGAFMDSATGVNPAVSMLNLGMPGMDMVRFLDTASARWDSIYSRISAAGFSRFQVQVVWFENATHIRNIPASEGIAHIDTMQARYVRAFRLLRFIFPNLKMIYCSGREYGGYCDYNVGNPEPYAYYTNVAYRRVVNQQYTGGQRLKMPWCCWAGSFWADGANVRADGLFWGCSDFEADGVHPSVTGEAKAAGVLIDFFMNDSTAAWFRY